MKSVDFVEKQGKIYQFYPQYTPYLFRESLFSFFYFIVFPTRGGKSVKLL